MFVPTKLHIFSGWGHQQNKNGIVVYSHVERNLAVGEVKLPVFQRTCIGGQSICTQILNHLIHFKSLLAHCQVPTCLRQALLPFSRLAANISKQ